MLERRHWVFDLDGTLTVAVHDFAAFKASHGLPLDQSILEAAAGLSTDARARLLRAVDAWEVEVAREARAPDDVPILLDALAARGARCAILTRNTTRTAWMTLEAAGLADRFVPAWVIGRDLAPPKPDPAGLRLLLDGWGADADDAVMVGDYLFDLQAGRACGVGTVYLDRGDTHLWDDHADVRVTRLDGLLK